MASQKKIKDIWKRKDDYMTSRVDWLRKKVGRAQSQFLEMLIADYIGKFSTDDAGKLKSTVGNTRLAITLDRFFDALDKETLRALNTKFGEDMLALTPMSGKYYEAMGTPKETVARIAKNVGFIEEGIGLKGGEIIEGGYLDSITKTPEIRQKLKNYVTSSVANKKGFSEYLKGLKEIVVGTKTRDGMFEKYYEQFAYNTFNTTDAAVNLHYAESLGLTWFVYSGSIIDTSRDFCIKRAGKTYNVKETEKWKCDPTLIGKPKGVKCDPKYNALIERGKWNCRHTIRYISADLACNNGREEACKEAEIL